MLSNIDKKRQKTLIKEQIIIKKPKVTIILPSESSENNISLVYVINQSVTLCSLTYSDPLSNTAFLGFWEAGEDTGCHKKILDSTKNTCLFFLTYIKD